MKKLYSDIVALTAHHNTERVTTYVCTTKEEEVSITPSRVDEELGYIEVVGTLKDGRKAVIEFNTRSQTGCLTIYSPTS